MKIAFAGNPNSGKTTMFNALTGQNEKVGNWAGVTVDKKEGLIKKTYAGDEKLIAIDLPGTYSMSPFTAEEGVTSAYIQNQAPDVIINIVDATNLSRSLFFTTQLLELNIPVVVALNKTDINAKKNTRIHREILEESLLCPVVETTALSGEGLQELIQTALSRVGQGQKAPFWAGQVDSGCAVSAQAADRRRFAFVNHLVKKAEKRQVRTNAYNRQDTVDAVLTHPVAGLVLFGLVMFLVFQISQAWIGPWLGDHLVAAIDSFKVWVANRLEDANTHDFLNALLTEGIIGGVSAVVSFLPLVMVMYFLVSLLEDCGYMARATVVLDPIFKKVGLSGKSVIPFVVGTGCAIPGIMAVRTIRNERERNATAMLTPFMPCGAKLPVIALFVGAFFPETPWVGTLMYFVGIGLILVGALLVNRITGSKNRRSYFIMELPEYKLPSLKRAVREMITRGWSYVVKAGTVILVCNAAVFLMQSFDWQLSLVEEGSEYSILATLARPAAYTLIPIVGIHAWQLAAAAVTGFIAKENVVGTLAVCYGFAINDNLEAASGDQVTAAMYLLTKAGALAYLMFNLFTPPCFAALAAMRGEVTQKKWFWGGVGLQLGIGYTVAFAVYQIGTLLATGQLGAGFVGGLIAVFGFIGIALCVRGDRKQSVSLEVR